MTIAFGNAGGHLPQFAGQGAVFSVDDQYALLEIGDPAVTSEGGWQSLGKQALHLLQTVGMALEPGDGICAA